MSDIEADLKAAFSTHLDPIEGWLLPPRIVSKARRTRAAMIVLAALGSVVFLGSGVLAVSALTSEGDGGRRIAPAISPAISPAPILERDNGPIAYADGVQVKSVRLDGSGEKVIPTPPGSPWGVSWSPDGTGLAVQLFPDVRLDAPRTIWVMDADGSNTVEVASADNVSVPSWSPDGTTLAYSASDGRQSAIHVVDADGTNDRVLLAESELDIFSAKFSPDGTKILFDRGTDSGFDIFIMNVDGSDLRRLTETGDSYNPSWSPDGTQIAFTIEDDGLADADSTPTSDIFVMNPDGTDVHRLTETEPGSTDLDPVWAPDGTKIAYQAGVTGGPGPVVVMNADGSNPKVLVNKDTLGISWQPK